MSRQLTLKELKIRYIKRYVEEANDDALNTVFKACADIPIPYSIPFADNPNIEVSPFTITSTDNTGNGECKDV